MRILEQSIDSYRRPRSRLSPQQTRLSVAVLQPVRRRGARAARTNRWDQHHDAAAMTKLPRAESAHQSTTQLRLSNSTRVRTAARP